MDLYADEGHLDATRENVFKSIFWEGGTQGDAFLTAAAAQVVQQITAHRSSCQCRQFLTHDAPWRQCCSCTMCTTFFASADIGRLLRVQLA